MTRADVGPGDYWTTHFSLRTIFPTGETETSGVTQGRLTCGWLKRNDVNSRVVQAVRPR